MLTDLECRNAVCPPERKQARFSDSAGLYLQVSPNGSKRWFLKYRVNNKEKQLALGSYPAVSLTAARRARDAAKHQKATGVDPVQARKVEKLKATNPEGDSFQVVALEWHAKQCPVWSEGHAARALRQFERDLFPWIGERRLVDIKPVELLATLRKIEERGAIETADRGLMLARQVWRYGVATGRVGRDITGDLKGALSPYQGGILLPSPTRPSWESCCAPFRRTGAGLSCALPYSLPPFCSNGRANCAPPHGLKSIWMPRCGRSPPLA